MFKKMLLVLAIVFTGLMDFAQSGLMQNLEERFVQYQSNAVQEKIFVHTDKSFYLAGETIWFKLYYTDASFNKPIDVSRLAYVDIINEDLKSVMQAKIALRDGSGNGSLIIPLSMASGSYKLRAYTHRMKNASADFFYEQTLTIVNTLKTGQGKGGAADLKYRADFFPEGGNLVNGISTVLGFKVTDQYGRGISAGGYISTNGKDTVAKIQTAKFGMGRVLLQPQKGIAYKAVIKINDTTIIQSLPILYEQGYTMKLDAGTPGDSLLTVTVSGTTGMENKTVYLFVHSRQSVKVVEEGKIINGRMLFTINRKKLADGISHITVFNESRQPVCERLYCKRPADKLLIQLKTDQVVYGERDKINLSLAATNPQGQPLKADLSVAVFMTDSLQPASSSDILAWFLLQSELRGKIESPQYYFNDTSAEATMALDNLMLTQGWRRFKWQDVINGSKPSFEFITEHEGPVITGMLTDKRTGAPSSHTLTTLTVPAGNFELRAAVSREDGSIQFNVNNYYGTNEIIVQTVNREDSVVKISVNNPFADKFSGQPFDAFILTDKWKDQLVKRSIASQAENTYCLDKKRQFLVPAEMDTNAFYGKTERRYMLDDYTRFITMEEVMKEFVLEVKVRKPAKEYQFRVEDLAYKTFFEQAPLVLIDGLPVSNMDKIMSFDPLKIKEIDVATHRHYLGPLIAEGVVSYKTYQGDLAGYELDPNAIVIEYEGLQKQREFYAPVYETALQQASRIPDLRNLLYWAPGIKTAGDGKQQCSFYTSDLPGNYMVVVQGLTAEGLPGSSTTAFRVTK